MRPHYGKRQNTDITAVPTASGIDGSTTAGNPSKSQLVVGTGTGLGTSSTGIPDFAPGFVSTPIATGLALLTAASLSRNSLVLTSTRTTTQPPSQTPSESPALSGANSTISLSTVIGACVGAFVGAGLLICLSIWFYRRSSRRPPPRARQKQPLAQSRGVNPATPWTRFDDGEDKWEGRTQMAEKGLGSVALHPGTQRTPSPHSTERSLTTADHFGSQHGVASGSMPLSHYHPQLAEQMALEPPRPIRADDQPKASLDGSTTGTFLSLGTVHIESGKMSPTFNQAKTTPPATASRLHRWESAEVIDPDARAQELEINPDLLSEKSTPTTYSPTDTFEDRKSLHNPFFNAHPGVHSRNPSTVRKSSAMSVSSDPFNKDEGEMMTMPKPTFTSHSAHDSSSSGGSYGNERSMQSLIAALDLPQEVIEERLRIASMQPSEGSRYSTAMDSSLGYGTPVPEAEHGYVQ